MFKKNHEVKLYDYMFSTSNGESIGEKLCKSPAHAESMRKKYEEAYGCHVSCSYIWTVIKRNGRTVCTYY